MKKPAKKILIIEDEGDICLLLNIMLKNREIDLDHVKTLEHARNYLVETQPNLILLDNKLPDGQGLDFIEYIRKHYPAIKIVMITGDIAASAKALELEYSADRSLRKPFTRQIVMESVNALLD